ncbi:SEL1-like repeat protein [Caviibacter abscessus]|uniref:hypothetical protein n=1 Tax=Caviibacter abscessus TaxID=1766719 RepID=UPI00082AC893|nr:hypothetical protein [Caviibacter abscessus]
MEDKYQEAINNFLNLEKAIEMLGEIADEDDRACFTLANIYLDFKNYDKANTYLYKSYKNGNIRSHYNYVMFLMEVKKDMKNAQIILEELKEKDLGLYYFLKARMTDDINEYILAYNEGVNAAALIIANKYENEKNIKEALKYYKLSDDYIAKESIVRLEKNNKKSFLNSITEFLKNLISK